MLTFYFLRHGETESNLIDSLQGFTDTPLTANGIKQAQALAKGMENVKLTRIYSSPSPRAYNTALAVAKNRNLTIQKHEGLREMNFGTKEGECNRFEGCTNYYELGTYDFSKFNGENIDMVTKRVGATLEYMINDNQYDKNGYILVATHGLAILSILRYISDEWYKQYFTDEYRFDNCSVTTIIWDDSKFELIGINDTSYVRNDKKE